jgi:lysophospholipase L1-like esterase
MVGINDMFWRRTGLICRGVQFPLCDVPASVAHYGERLHSMMRRIAENSQRYRTVGVLAKESALI